MAIALTKIYTRGGDRGTTALIGGRRVSKAEARIDAYGTVDELNAAIGLARSWLDGLESGDADERSKLGGLLKRLQNELFDLGCDLATPPDARHEDRPIATAEMVEHLEKQIDAYNQTLPELRSFVLPGGGMAAAFLHQARTICRRAERIVVALADREAIGDHALIYLNRLSDLLFVLSRAACRHEGRDEYLWEYRK